MAEEKKGIKRSIAVLKLSKDLDLDKDPTFRAAVDAEMRLCKGGLYGAVGSTSKEDLYLQDLPQKLRKTNNTNYMDGNRYLILYFMKSEENIVGMIVAIYPSVEQLIPRHQAQTKSKGFQTDPHLRFMEEASRKNKMVDIVAICAGSGLGTRLWNHFVHSIRTSAHTGLPDEIKHADFTADVRGGRTDLKRELKWRGDNEYPKDGKHFTKLHTQEEPMKNHGLPPASEPKLLKVFTDLEFHESVPYAEKKNGEKFVWISGENKIPLFVFGKNEDIVRKAAASEVTEKKAENKQKGAAKMNFQRIGTLIAIKVHQKRVAERKAREKWQEVVRAAVEAKRKAKHAEEEAKRLATEDAARKADQAKKDAEAKERAVREAELAAKKAQEAAMRAEQEAKAKEMENRLAAERARQEAEARKKLSKDEKYPPPPPAPSRSRSSSKSPPAPSSSPEATIIGVVSKSQLPGNAYVPRRRRPAPSLSQTAKTGKGGKGKRHRVKDTMKGITKNGIRRLARRGGVRRINGGVYEDVRGVLKKFLERIIQQTVLYTNHAHRKTVSAMDVVHALKRDGRPLYGFGG